MPGNESFNGVPQRFSSLGVSPERFNSAWIIDHCSVSLCDSDERFRPVSKSLIVVTGPLLKISRFRWDCHPLFASGPLELTIISDIPNDDRDGFSIGIFYPDILEDYEIFGSYEADSAFCLVGAISSDAVPEEGIVIVPTGRWGNSFKRIGMFRTWNRSWNNMTLPKTWSKKSWYEDWYKTMVTTTVSII